MSKVISKMPSFIERAYIGVLSGILALVTGTFIWFVALRFLALIDIYFEPSFTYVIIFCAVMFILGFASMENWVLNILEAIWKYLYRFLGRFWF